MDTPVFHKVRLEGLVVAQTRNLQPEGQNQGQCLKSLERGKVVIIGGVDHPIPRVRDIQVQVLAHHVHPAGLVAALGRYLNIRHLF